MRDILIGLDDLGQATEDMGNVCFLCDYQPCSIKNCKSKHDPHDNCLVSQAMKIVKQFKTGSI